MVTLSQRASLSGAVELKCTSTLLKTNWSTSEQTTPYKQTSPALERGTLSRFRFARGASRSVICVVLLWRIFPGQRQQAEHSFSHFQNRWGSDRPLNIACRAPDLCFLLICVGLNIGRKRAGDHRWNLRVVCLH